MSTAITPPVLETPPSNRNGLGLAALLIGIGAVVFAFIPFLSYIAWAVGIIAVVLGILAVRRVGGRKGGAITGIVLGAIAVLLSIVMSIVYTALFAIAAAAGGIASASSAPAESAPPVAPSATASSGADGTSAGQKVVYRISGSGTATDITYLSVNGSGDSGSEQVTKAKMPWTKTLHIESNDLFTSSVFSLVAQNAGSGSITCSITADGKVISKHTSSGQYAVVTCTGTTGQ